MRRVFCQEHVGFVPGRSLKRGTSSGPVEGYISTRARQTIGACVEEKLLRW